MRRSYLLILSLLCVLASCRNGGDDTSNAPLQPVKVIVYVRAGGIAGADDRIFVTGDGEVRVSGRSFGNLTGKLTEFQLLQLARLFEGWEKLQDNYPAPSQVRDALTYSISYGDKTVSVSDTSSSIPEQFTMVRRRLEQIANALPPPQTGR